MQIGCALGATDAKFASLILAAKTVILIVIDRKRTTYPVAIIKNSGGAGVKGGTIGMNQCFGMYTFGIAQNRTNEIQIVNRVQQYLYPWQTL